MHLTHSATFDFLMVMTYPPSDILRALSQQRHARRFADLHRFAVPYARLYLAYVGASHHKHAKTRLTDTAADGKGKLAFEKHLVEGKNPSFVAPRKRQLSVKRLRVNSDSH